MNPLQKTRRPLRITFVLPHAGLSGGIRVVAIYAENLRRRGHKVLAVSTPLYFKDKLRALARRVRSGKWKSGTESHFDGMQVEHRVLESCRSVTDADVPDADVVIATWWEQGRGVLDLSPTKGAKIFFVQNYEAMPGESHPRLEEFWRMPFKKVVISRWLEELATDEFGDSDVIHVPNGVDLEQFYAPPRGKQKTPTVGVLYHRWPLKGWPVTCEAIRIAREKIPNLQFVCFGAECPSAKYPLPERTEFTFRPAQERIKDIYSRCDAWLCGSHREGFHLPPLEAMACRCPVVSTRVGGPLDVVEEGVNGHLVEIGDIGALAERLLRVLSLPEQKWKTMSDAAFTTARRYTWNDATDLFEAALYQTLETRQGKMFELESELSTATGRPVSLD